MNVTPVGIAVALAVVVALGFLFFGSYIFTPFASSPTTMTTEQPQNEAPAPAPIGDVTELQVNDVQVGNGAVAETGDTVTVEYVGALPDGTVFDASQTHGEPFTFTLGTGAVIKGWDDGIVGMKEGGIRVLVIPADQAYGAAGRGPIPPNSPLIFQVLLVKVDKGA
jgi:FKBP-type peptidyl-prolyl cis-trans isomerase